MIPPRFNKKTFWLSVLFGAILGLVVSGLGWFITGDLSWWLALLILIVVAILIGKPQVLWSRSDK